MLNDDERQAMESVNAAMAAVLRIGSDRLRANVQEVTAAVHVLQGFVIQHAVGRLHPDEFGTWYEPADDVKER